MKTIRILALLSLVTCHLSLGTGCVGVSYQRQSFAPDGKPQEVVKATARSLFTAKSFDTLKAAVTSTTESRTFSVSRYNADPDAEAIKATGSAVGGVVGGALPKP